MLGKGNHQNEQQQHFGDRRPMKKQLSAFCVCGARKENRKQRYCNECEKFHISQMSLAHAGKGRGPRLGRRIKRELSRRIV